MSRIHRNRNTAQAERYQCADCLEVYSPRERRPIETNGVVRCISCDRKKARTERVMSHTVSNDQLCTNCRTPIGTWGSTMNKHGKLVHKGRCPRKYTPH